LIIVVDTKNLALYGGGIAQWFAPLLATWVELRADARFLLLGPTFNNAFLPNSGNWEHVFITWPQWLPRPLRHPFYDNVLFPRAVAKLQPDLVMSPYHDVRMPKAVPSVISVLDLCIDELSAVYPRRIRGYYLSLLRSNLRRATHVITCSQTSKYKIASLYGIPLERISVVYSAVSDHFSREPSPQEFADFKSRHELPGRFLLYSGGSEYRKNIERLVEAFSLLVEKENDLTLLVTGNQDPRWTAALKNITLMKLGKVRFAGKLSDWDMRVAYSAADVVVYPSLCEGFGRVCLEAMEVGTPLACSDLPVLKEVTGDYALRFDPYDTADIAAVIATALAQKRREAVRDPRFQSESVQRSFLAAMDAVVDQN